MFRKGTGLTVHYMGLTMDKISPTRVVNFNHASGPHEVDQHAVIIKNTSSYVPCTLGGPSIPRNIGYIQMPTKPQLVDHLLSLARGDDEFSLWNYISSMYPTELAHELGHSVNIWHHGTIDPGRVTWFTDESAAQIFENGVPISVELENGTLLSPADLNITPAHSIQPWVGTQRGQHSGDVFCFMRYNVSEAYVSSVLPSLRFYAAEYPGTTLTDMVSGSGTNLSTHRPQSRYGDADLNLGNCSVQFCVNDNANPPPRISGGSSGAACPQ
jgi:hypothetical protein